MSHTLRRLKVSDNNSSRILIQHGVKEWVELARLRKPYNTPENAARLVTCWNACEDINPEAVQGMRNALKQIARLFPNAEPPLDERVCPPPDIYAAIICQDALAKAEAK